MTGKMRAVTSEMSTSFPLPDWKDENPLIYQKMQLSNKIRKLKRDCYLTPTCEIKAEIARLEEIRNLMNKQDRY